MPFHRPSPFTRVVACVTTGMLLFQASAALAGIAAPVPSAFALRPVLLASTEAAPAPTSAAAMGAAPKKSKRTWLYVGLAALAVGGVAVLAGGGGDSASSTPVAPPDPPPPPPPSAAHGGAR